MKDPVEIIEAKLCAVLGIRPRGGALASLRREVERFRKETGMPLDDVVRRIDADPSIVRRLAGAITVEETFFFRHPEHFERLVAHARTVLDASPMAGLSIWSAGCSSGEEPYSIAIAIHRALGPAALARTTIVANDIDADALRKAHDAVYGEWSFRNTSPNKRAIYFEKTEGPEWRVADVIHRAVVFQHRTLEEQLALTPPASLDVIFFRNVAIYLTPEALTRIYHGFGRVLREQGLLVLGPADPLPATIELTRAFVETTSLSSLDLGAEPVGDPARSRPPAPRRRSLLTPLPSDELTGIESPRAIDRPTPIPYSFERRSPVPRAPEAILRLPPQGSVDEGDPVRRAERLLALARPDEAMALVESALASQGATAALLGVRGHIRVATGDAASGVDDLRSALFLAPSDAHLRFYYALGLEMLSLRKQARAQALDVLRALESSCDDAMLADGETTAGTLRRAANELLRRLE